MVEAGTSFGVSTIYLALARGSECHISAIGGQVIATENEPSKADRARRIGKWLVTRWRSGSNFGRETCGKRSSWYSQCRVDFLLLDSECLEQIHEPRGGLSLPISASRADLENRSLVCPLPCQHWLLCSRI